MKKRTTKKKPGTYGKTTVQTLINGEWVLKFYDTLDFFLADFTPHVQPSGSFLERLKYVFEYGGEIGFNPKQYGIRTLFYFHKSTYGGKRPGSGKKKKFPGYETKYINVLVPVECESGVKAAIVAYLDGALKEDEKQKAGQ